MSGELIYHGLVLGSVVRRLRQSRDWTQEQVADRMAGEADGNWVTRLETGRIKHLPSQPRVSELAHAFDIPEIELLKEAGVITETLPEPGAPRELFPKGDVRAKIVELMTEMSARSAADLLGMAEFLTDREGREGRERG